MKKPNIIRLNEATYDIRRACDACHEEKEPSPFFFITGAGISNPPIPLARTIIEDCKKRAQGHPIASDPESGKVLDEYSYWFARAFPQPHHRKQYFKKLIAGSYISPANFRLAHLLLNERSDRRLTNLVFTLNFDDFLSRALHIFGKSHVICDHPLTTARVDLNDSETPQIVHVHGSYHFYDCRNLAEEIVNTAYLSPTSLSMPSLLDSALRHRSPLVVGYSGWEGDIVMSALYRRLNGHTLPFNLYWFCYSRKNIDSLPEWLKFHENVRFVAADEGRQIDSSLLPLREATSSIGTTEKSVSSMQSAVDLLPAHAVFDALIREFELPAPRISLDPLAFYASEMERNLPKEELALDAEDLYQFRSLVRRIKGVRQVIESVRPKESSESDLETIREAIRTSRFEDAIRDGLRFASTIAAEARLELLNLLFSAASSLNDNSELEVSVYDLVIEDGRSFDSFSDDGAFLLASALRAKGLLLYNIGRLGDVPPLLEECITRFSGHHHPEVQRQVFRSTALLGLALLVLGRGQEAISIFEKAQKDFGRVDDAENLSRLVLMALIHARALVSGNRVEEAVSMLGVVVERYGDVSSELQASVAAVQFEKLVVCGMHGKLERAILEAESLIKKFAGSGEPEIAEWVVKAWYNKGVYLKEMGKVQEALPVFEGLCRELRTTSSEEMRDIFLRSMDNKGAVLFGMNRHEEALAAFDELNNSIPDRSEQHQAFWVDVLWFRGSCLVQLERLREALTSFEALIHQFANSTLPGTPNKVAAALLISGRLYHFMGDLVLAQQACTKAIEYVNTHSSNDEMKVILTAAEETLSIVSGKRQ